MDIKDFLIAEGEKPLDRMPTDGGFMSIFRTVACVGDSLSSGEFQVKNPLGDYVYTDQFAYSWGQYIARMSGVKVYNFSRGGMSAREFMTGWAKENGCFDEEKRAQAYFIALGVNDLVNQNQEIGSIADIHLEDETQNAPTYYGYMGQIIQTYRKIAPDSKIFLVGMPFEPHKERFVTCAKQQREVLYALAELFENTYVLDLFEYAPPFDEEFHKTFFLHGHMAPTGYYVFAKIIASYVDYLVRKNPKDFKLTGMINLNVPMLENQLD